MTPVQQLILERKIEFGDMAELSPEEAEAVERMEQEKEKQEEFFRQAGSGAVLTALGIRMLLASTKR